MTGIGQLRNEHFKLSYDFQESYLSKCLNIYLSIYFIYIILRVSLFTYLKGHTDETLNFDGRIPLRNTRYVLSISKVI